MENPGERLVGDYLRYIKGCDFVDFNVYTRRTQGEIDVVGVNHGKRVEEEIKSRTGVEIFFVINADYVHAIDELRAFARQEPKELKSPIMRFLQIEEWSRKNLGRRGRQPGTDS